MDDWSKYSHSKATQSDVSGKRPTVVEYALIKIVDNSLVVFLAILTLLFAVVGLYAGSYASWFFDVSKLTLGVLLGTLTKTKSEPTP